LEAEGNDDNKALKPFENASIW